MPLKMPNLARLLLFGVPILLLILTAIAGYAYSQIRFLNIPISQSLALFTVVLPLITGLSTRAVYNIIRSTKPGQNKLTLPLLAIIGFQLIYETIVGTLALTHLVPPSALACGLETRWKALYKARNGLALTAIQDAFNCCGFNNVNQMAFPFGSPSNCDVTYGRTQSCSGAWKQQEQVEAGLLFLVAVTVFTVKVISLIPLFTNASWAHPSWATASRRGTISSISSEEDNRATIRNLIENGTGNGNQEYHDEEAPPERAPEPASNRALEGGVVAPGLLGASPSPSRGGHHGGTENSRPDPLVDVENAWMDQEEEHAA